MLLLTGHDGPLAVDPLVLEVGVEPAALEDGTQVEFTYVVRRFPAPQYSVLSPAQSLLQSDVAVMFALAPNLLAQ